MAEQPRFAGRPRIVALGGGHGLYASLSALRLLDVEVTAVVTVADDGGSSGRIRRELGLLPPGDLRMALSALATGGCRPTTAADRTAAGRRGGSTAGGRAGPQPAGCPGGPAAPDGRRRRAGRPPDRQPAADRPDGAAPGPGGRPGRVAGLVGARAGCCRCRPSRWTCWPRSPASTRTTRCARADPRPVRDRGHRRPGPVGQLVPEDAPACPEAVRAILAADAVILGPGSWFTSVIPHLLVRGLAERADHHRRPVDHRPQPGAAGRRDRRLLTGGAPAGAARALSAARVDVVIADEDAVLDRAGLRSYAENTGARLVLAPVAAADARARHDPCKLSMAVADAAGLGGTDGGVAPGRLESQLHEGVR